MARRILIVRLITIGPLGSALAILFLIFAFCPWTWNLIPDSYFPYSGVVVDKGSDYHLLDRLLTDYDDPRSYYIILTDERGSRTKKYVNSVAYMLLEKGTFVVKKRGLGEMPLRPGQKSPSEILQELEKRKTGK